MLALCLQTCDRYALTKRTLETFAAHNDLRRFRLYHADDASTDPAVLDLVHAYGFETVAQTVTRFGTVAVRRALFEVAARRGEPWAFFLENDIETLRPFPWKLFDHIKTIQGVYCLRLYGRHKDAARKEPCLTTHKRTREVVQWGPLIGAPESSQIGQIHWSAQPCVTRMAELLAHHRRGTESLGLTVRVKKNVTSHIGTGLRTPGRII